MSTFYKIFNNIVESVVDYSASHKHRQQNHTFTDIDKNYTRKSQNLVPDYVKKPSSLKQELNKIQKYGGVKIFYPNDAHELLGKYKIDITQLKQGIDKQLGNMNLKIHFDSQTGNFIVTRI